MKILKSLMIVFAMVAMVAGATSSYFSDTATIAGNTFSTGKLEIRVDGLQTIPGMHFNNNAPGDVRNSVPYLITDSGILGDSTLSARTLLLSAANFSGNADLKNAVKIQVEARKNLGTWTEIYYGDIALLTNKDMLTPLGLSELEPFPGGPVLGLRYRIGVPETGLDQNALMDKSMG